MTENKTISNADVIVSRETTNFPRCETCGGVLGAVTHDRRRCRAIYMQRWRRKAKQEAQDPHSRLSRLRRRRKAINDQFQGDRT